MTPDPLLSILFLLFVAALFWDGSRQNTRAANNSRSSCKKMTPFFIYTIILAIVLHIAHPKIFPIFKSLLILFQFGSISCYVKPIT